MTPEANRALLTEYLLREARKDPAVFNRLVHRDDRTGEPWDTQPFHREWLDAIEADDWEFDPDGNPIVRLVIFAPAGHGKSQQIARSWIERKLGSATLEDRPIPRTAILSNVVGQAEKRVTLIRKDIESNKRMHAVYPKLRRSAAGTWTTTELMLDAENPTMDPHIQAVGLHGAILGARLDVGVVDDPCDFENTWTDAQRKKALAWYRSSFESRFDGRGIIVVIMTSWNEGDLGHALVRDHGYKGITYSACDENFENILWESRYPENVLRGIMARMGPIEFARTMRNKIMDDSFRRIQMSWIQKCLDRGLGVPPDVKPEGATMTICGVDPSGKKKKSSDLWAFTPFSVMPNGDRHLINCFTDRMTSPEGREEVGRIWRLCNPVFYVEDNGVQVWFKQEIVHSTAIPVKGLTTTVAKWDPATGVESIGIELFNAKWIIPSVWDENMKKSVAATRGLQMLVDQMSSFEHGAHTGDGLMSLYVGRCGVLEEEACKVNDYSDIGISAGNTQSNIWSP
jgi:hypothetical protein